MRFGGTDRHTHASVTGKGIYYTDDPVPVDALKLSPRGDMALAVSANQLYLLRLVSLDLPHSTVNLASPSVASAQLTSVGVDFFDWNADGSTILWSTGHRLHHRSVESIEFREDTDSKKNEMSETVVVAEPEETASDQPAGHSQWEVDLKETHEAVTTTELAVNIPRAVPEGRIALIGATLMPMRGDQAVLEDSVVVLECNRIAAVGVQGEMEVPEDAKTIDLTGKYLLPGFIDTRTLRYHAPRTRPLKLIVPRQPRLGRDYRH